MHKILIVEDEDVAAEALRRSLERYSREKGQTFAVSHSASALDLDDLSGVDLVFMDIDLPGVNGFDAAIELRKRNHTTVLIFVTNLAQYAVKGYAAEALDFIVKPFSYGDFALRMDRAMVAMGQKRRRAVSVVSRGETRIFDISELVFIEVSGHNLDYHLTGSEMISARSSLKAVTEELADPCLLKISSSCIINMAHVRGVADAQVALSDGSTVWISRANKRRCLEAISRYLGGMA